MKTRFFFDVEATNLHGEGFAYGYVVVSMNESGNELKLLEQGECYSIAGAQNAAQWTKENVLPALTLLAPYLKTDADRTLLPKEIVISTKELRDNFYQTYSRWKQQGAEFWSDVNFPVETNFLAAVVKDGNGSRDWEMPYPLRDVSAFVDVNVNRNDYSELSNLRQHNPLDDSLASAYSLHKYEMELSRKNTLSFSDKNNMQSEQENTYANRVKFF